MTKFRLNQRGNASIAMIAVGVALTAGTVGLLNSIGQKTELKTGFKQLENGRLMIDKVKTLGNFLVSNGAIACKEQPFASQTDGYLCEWTGRQLAGGKLKKIEPETLGLTLGGYDDKGFLQMDVDFSKLFKDEEENTSQVVDIEGKVSFKLYNPEVDKDPWNLKGKLGSIPEVYRHSDKDNSFVIMQVQVRKKKPRDEEEAKAGGLMLKGFFAVRRPLAVAAIELDDAVCKTACDAAQTYNDNPACRGEQKSDGELEEVELKAVTTNQGPGILYDLDLEKSVEFDKKFFKTDRKGKPQEIDALPDKDYLLPGESVQWADSVKCRTYASTTTRTITQSRARGTCREGSRPVPCPTSGAQNSTTLNQHSEPGGEVKYGLDISSPEDKTEKIEEVEGTLECVGSTKSSKDGVTRQKINELGRAGACEAYNIQRRLRKGKIRISSRIICDMSKRNPRVACKNTLSDLATFSKFACSGKDAVSASLSCIDDNCKACKYTYKTVVKESKLASHAGLSDIQPKRIVKKIDTKGDVPMMHKETVIIRIIATH